MQLTKKSLRASALHTLFEPTILEKAIEKLKFVQADPIRSPARAQDLILRHRVMDYHTGDLETKYHNLPYEEDYLYMYGFLPKEVSDLWHPIKPKGLTKFDKKVLVALGNLGPIHPKKLSEILGNKRVRNWWGGNSQAAKHSLDILHWWGQVRVVKREKGIRVYELRSQLTNSISLQKRKEELVMTIVNLLGPITDKKLTSALHRFKFIFGESKETLTKLLKSSALTKQKVDGVNYIWLTESKFRREAPFGVKFLTPFDPVVWDRDRFEHLWGWRYRFEAYTPKEKRTRGYYAMPLLWNEDVVGWANVVKVGISPNVELGFVKEKPKSKMFERDLNLEIDKLKTFLQPLP